MAYGNEIQFGVIGQSNVFDLVRRLNLEVKTYDDEKLIAPADYDTLNVIDNEVWIETDGIDDVLRDSLRQAHDRAMDDAGYIFKGYDKSDKSYSRKDYPIYETPWGLRQVSPFRLNYIFDKHEMGESPDDMSIGIALSSRYYPTFLDLKDAHGGIYNIDLREALKASKNAISIICEEIPEFAIDTTVFLKEKHY